MNSNKLATEPIANGLIQLQLEFKQPSRRGVLVANMTPDSAPYKPPCKSRQGLREH